jgi:hypothetical protein
MAIEPDIEIIRRLRVARAAHPKDGPTDRALAFAMSEIEALRSRVAAQDAELTRLRGLVGDIAEEGYSDKGDCPYFTYEGTCSFGCHSEPSCHTDNPPDGWPSTRIRAVLAEAEARAEVPR